MTIATFPGERWEESDGAPMGAADFDLHVPSSSDPETVYRLIRDRTTGVIIHKPMCTAWKFGHHDCRHLKAAVERAEQPAAVFLATVADLYATSTWWAHGELPAQVNDLLVAVKLALDEARMQLAQNASLAKARTEVAALPAEDAWREFA